MTLYAEFILPRSQNTGPGLLTGKISNCERFDFGSTVAVVVGIIIKKLPSEAMGGGSFQMLSG